MSAKCPICHNEYFIVKDIVCTGLGNKAILLERRHISLNVLSVVINSTRVSRRKKLF